MSGWAVSESVFCFLKSSLYYMSALEADLNDGAFRGRKYMASLGMEY